MQAHQLSPLCLPPRICCSRQACIPSVAPERLLHVEPPLVESQRRNDDCCRIAGWLDGRDAQRTTPRASVAVPCVGDRIARGQSVQGVIALD